MTDVRVKYVDVYVLRTRAGAAGLDVLCLRRAPDVGRAGAWEAVHGTIEPGERPADAARRELREETGLVAERLYNVSRVEMFYLHASDEIALIPTFCAMLPAGAPVALSAEHDRAEWVPPEEAMRRLVWPRERRAVADILVLFGGGTAGPVEDVLRVV